jgi:hypothetical protein
MEQPMNAELVLSECGDWIYILSSPKQCVSRSASNDSIETAVYQENLNETIENEHGQERTVDKIDACRTRVENHEDFSSNVLNLIYFQELPFPNDYDAFDDINEFNACDADEENPIVEKVESKKACSPSRLQHQLQDYGWEITDFDSIKSSTSDSSQASPLQAFLENYFDTSSETSLDFTDTDESKNDKEDKSIFDQWYNNVVSSFSGFVKKYGLYALTFGSFGFVTVFLVIKYRHL